MVKLVFKLSCSAKTPALHFLSEDLWSNLRVGQYTDLQYVHIIFRLQFHINKTKKIFKNRWFLNMRELTFNCTGERSNCFHIMLANIISDSLKILYNTLVCFSTIQIFHLQYNTILTLQYFGMFFYFKFHSTLQKWFLLCQSICYQEN